MTAPHPATTRRGGGERGRRVPTRVFFGRGVAGQAGAHAAGLGVRRVMLVTDPGVQAAGLADPVRVQLIAAGLEVVDFQQVEPNPRDVDGLAGADLAAEFGAEGLVAVGGGSAIGSAKCIALLRTNGGHPRRSPPCSPAKWRREPGPRPLRKPMDVPCYRIDPVESPSH
jgi:alcohol dehydrogenase class IV